MLNIPIKSTEQKKWTMKISKNQKKEKKKTRKDRNKFCCRQLTSKRFSNKFSTRIQLKFRGKYGKMYLNL